MNTDTLHLSTSKFCVRMYRQGVHIILYIIKFYEDNNNRDLNRYYDKSDGLECRRCRQEIRNESTFSCYNRRTLSMVFLTSSRPLLLPQSIF